MTKKILGLLVFVIASHLSSMDSSSLCKVVALQKAKPTRKFSALRHSLNYKQPAKNEKALEFLGVFECSDDDIDSYQYFLSKHTIDPCQWVYHNMPNSIFGKATISYCSLRLKGINSSQLNIDDSSCCVKYTISRSDFNFREWDATLIFEYGLDWDKRALIQYENVYLDPNKIFHDLIGKEIPINVEEWGKMIVDCMEKNNRFNE